MSEKKEFKFADLPHQRLLFLLHQFQLRELSLDELGEVQHLLVGLRHDLTASYQKKLEERK